jgi:hypothetical protein
MRQRPQGQRPRVTGWVSRAGRPNERWAIDTTHLFCGRDGWCHLTAIIDCCDRTIVGWRLSRSGIAGVAAAALEDALRDRGITYGHAPLMLRSDNGLVFGAKVFVNPRGRVTVANRVNIESYLRGVLPHELGKLDATTLEAGKAQAVAARTYTLSYVGRRADEGFDLYDSVEDQVYGGTASEGPFTDRAVLETEGVVALHSAPRYHVYMVGFLPGFPYLGGVPAALEMPRLASPRKAVPARSIAIAGRMWLDRLDGAARREPRDETGAGGTRGPDFSADLADGEDVPLRAAGAEVAAKGR